MKKKTGNSSLMQLTLLTAPLSQSAQLTDLSSSISSTSTKKVLAVSMFGAHTVSSVFNSTKVLVILFIFFSDGASISSFFFLDNQTQPIAGNTLWKYAVTLANNNTEIKVYKCENWKELQTITFKSPTGSPLVFKAEIDRTSSYLILSDMNNRQMYVLQILKENALNQLNESPDEHQNGEDATSGGISRVFVKSIAEFQLASYVLSYGICKYTQVTPNPFNNLFVFSKCIHQTLQMCS